MSTVGFTGGADLPGGPLGLLTLALAALGIAYTASGFGLGLAFRMRSLAAATLTQFAIFFTIFLSTAQMPLHFIKGWVKPIARVNPITNVLRLAREGFLGQVTWGNSWGGILALVVLGVITTAFAVTGLRLVAVSENLVIPASHVGKLKTLSQNVAIAWIILQVGYQWQYDALLALAVVLTVLSGAYYFIMARRRLFEARTPAPDVSGDP